MQLSSTLILYSANLQALSFQFHTKTQTPLISNNTTALLAKHVCVMELGVNGRWGVIMGGAHAVSAGNGFHLHLSHSHLQQA
jgi:hypothetical protein